MRRVLMLLPVACLTLAACDPGQVDEMTRDFTAYDACTQAVSDQLKAPSSADFQSDTDVQYAKSSDGLYTVTGWVDAQNGFGAKIRNDWICQVTIGSDGTPSGAQVLDIAPR